MLDHVLAGGIAPLADPRVLVRDPASALVEEPRLDTEVDDLAGERDALAVAKVELGLAERRSQLVLGHLHTRPAADDLLALLERADAPDVQADRGVELERIAAGGRLGVAEHDADLHAQLVDEDDERLALRARARELAQGLAHQPRLEPHVRVTHLAF